MNKEVCLNLYYVYDDQGIIYSLRIHPYVIEGSDEKKLNFLRERAPYDYLIARPFEIPKNFYIFINNERVPVGHITMLKTLDSPLAIFEDAIKEVEDSFPAQSAISISESPIICITALRGDEDGNIYPCNNHYELFK